MRGLHSFFKLVFLGLILISVLFTGCSRKPLVAVNIDSVPHFTDDLDLDSLKKAVQSNLDYLNTLPPDTIIHFADRSYPIKRLILSLDHFFSSLASNPSQQELDQFIRKNYDAFQATGTSGFNPWRRMLITGYFQPVFEGSLTKSDPFLYPLYAIPDDLIREKNIETGERNFSRIENNKIVPYWTREEIEKDNRAAGYELVWLKDPFDAFVLHVQGSGLISLQDGTIRGVHYAVKNGHPYRSIGKYMVETGKITLEEASLKTIRDYIAQHPEEREEILYHNPSFIFFEWTQSRGAIGSLGKELTAGRSIAVDQACFPAGGLGFLLTRKPTKDAGGKVVWNPLRRFVLVQDTGSAIKGPGRADLFWGKGPKAGFEAGLMKEKGTLYFLLLKDEALNQIAIK